ncbi:MAG TPA: MBL fold metallo-hydrolase, partial [Candidatus Wirthbacteria bacterium]|nr:MBL fold metallo-hydrolase [Candidatus Wirthbacteria bacterium]
TLITGYAKQLPNGWQASSTVVYIESNGLRIIADPGFDRASLLKALERARIQIKNIDYVFLTHGHPDHSLLAGIFENATILDELYCYHQDLIFAHNGLVPHTDLQIIRTPGHMEEHCSLLVPTLDGTYAIAGDVFWWPDNEAQIVDINKPDFDPEHLDQAKLTKSRQTLLSGADYIIPGHGELFKVDK